MRESVADVDDEVGDGGGGGERMWAWRRENVPTPGPVNSDDNRRLLRGRVDVNSQKSLPTWPITRGFYAVLRRRFIHDILPDPTTIIGEGEHVHIKKTRF